MAFDASLPVAAAVEVGNRGGYDCAAPVVLQDTNNVVVHLAPHDIVAKVGRWPHSAEVLAREVDVAAHLVALGAPVAAPVGGLRHGGTPPRPVSLWHRLPIAADGHPRDDEVADALRCVHNGLATYGGALPSFRVAVDLARATLIDDRAMAALPVDDLGLLRRSFERWAGAASDHVGPEQALHGEPHANNVLTTADGRS